MINIITDSTCDLGSDLATRFGLHTIPLYVIVNGQTYIDGVDITLGDLYHSVDETGQLPKTSAPTVLDFQQAFSQAGENIYLSLSSQLSATFQNACLAKESMPERPLHLIDSLNLSTGIGLLALKATDLRDQGLPAEEIVERISALRSRVHTSFVLETLDYLYKGGRCSALQNVMGSLLHIRPVIEVRQDGTLGVKAKTRGTRKKGLQALLDDVQANLNEIDRTRIFVTHSGCVEDAVYLKSELGKLADFEEILITRAGSVIASHCGPDTIGILYLTE